MPYAEAALNIGANAIAAAVTALSMHTADPGGSGAHEVTGGSPAYARQAPAYSSADDGVAALSAAEDFNIPASTTITHFGQWAGSTWLGGFELDDSETFANQGVYRLASQPISVGNP